LHVLDQRGGRAAQRDRPGRRLRGSRRVSLFPSPACGGGQGRGLLLDRLRHVAPADRSARATALDRRQVDAAGAGEKLGALADLDGCGLGSAVGWSRLRSGFGGGLDLRWLWSRDAAVGPDFNFGKRRADRNRLAGVGQDLHQFAGRGAGTSASTLSVVTSTSASPSRTGS